MEADQRGRSECNVGESNESTISASADGSVDLRTAFGTVCNITTEFSSIHHSYRPHDSYSLASSGRPGQLSRKRHVAMRRVLRAAAQALSVARLRASTLHMAATGGLVGGRLEMGKDDAVNLQRRSFAR